MTKTWLFIGPRLLAGIGQVTNRYAELLREAGHEAEYVEFGQQPKRESYDRGFAFVLPTHDHIQITDVYTSRCKDVMYMTICETEPVNEAYGTLAKYGTLYVASDFCKNVFSKQFPEIKWEVLRLFASGTPSSIPKQIQGPYIFYTIGNIMDPRKNIRGLIDAYLRCEFRDAAHLVLKATCMQDVTWRVPGVTVINGLLSNEDLEKVHDQCHCYVNCSHSEGVGMGAVEAALRAKPVIITDYGGLKEYVQTPWVVKCTVGPIGFDDFLFKSEHQWGFPSGEDLQRCLQDCFDKKVRTWDHSHTRELMLGVQQHSCWEH
jgi:glycosyltransferase involved in cell wall biosynthesis